MAFTLDKLGTHPEIINFEADEGFSKNADYVHVTAPGEVAEQTERFIRTAATYGDVAAIALTQVRDRQIRDRAVLQSALALHYDNPDKSSLITNSDEEIAKALQVAEKDIDLSHTQNDPVPYPDSLAFLDDTFTQMELILRRSGIEVPESVL